MLSIENLAQRLQQNTEQEASVKATDARIVTLDS